MLHSDSLRRLQASLQIIPRPPAHAQHLTLLLDCDNTLVQSEPLAFAGCAALLTEILNSHGHAVVLSGPELQERFVGQNFRGMLASLSKEYGLVIQPDELEVLVKREEAAVIAKLEAGLLPCEGVKEAMHAVSTPDVTLAVVSSSALRRVHVSLEVTDLDAYFGDRVYSAANSLPVPTSKPDPAIYLFAMGELGVTPESSVAVEDSRSGTLAAVRAGISTMGYVGAYEPQERDEMDKALREAGAQVVMHHWREFGDCLKQMGWSV